MGPVCSLGNPVLHPSCDSPAPTSTGAHFLLLCLIAANARSGAVLGQSRVCPDILDVRCLWAHPLQGARGTAEGIKCASSWDHSRCLAPRELFRMSQSPWTGAVGEAAVPAVPTCAGPAACAQQELSCIAFVAGCSVCKKYGASKDWLCCLAGGRRINQVPFLLYLLAIHFYSRLFSRQQWNF